MKRAWSHLTGSKFTHLTVIYPAPDVKSGWRCACTCGKLLTVKEKDLISRVVSSCGCMPPIIRNNRWYRHQRLKHGMSGTTEYKTWAGMKQRCENPNNKYYEDYGGRGVQVCARWTESFANFFADMGRKPHPNLSIDRIDNNGNYEPGNCRWATAVQQMSNTSVTNGDT